MEGSESANPTPPVMKKIRKGLIVDEQPQYKLIQGLIDRIGLGIGHLGGGSVSFFNSQRTFKV